jgi:SAM-dependent methyltransferase
MSSRDLLLDDRAAAHLVNSEAIIWYQRYHLSPNVVTPGVHDIEEMFDMLGIPQDLSGLSVLDIGTANGGAAFIAERRGAKRVVAVDIYDPHEYGFAQVAAALGSRAEFHRTSVYELPMVLGEQFDVVLFLGVLYHLRHPLLALDAVRRCARGQVFVDTAVTPSKVGVSHAEFYAGPYEGDTSNWFVPSVSCVIDWMNTSGFKTDLISAWLDDAPYRATFVAQVTEEDPLWSAESYEKPLTVLVQKD